MAHTQANEIITKREERNKFFVSTVKEDIRIPKKTLKEKKRKRGILKRTARGILKRTAMTQKRGFDG